MASDYATICGYNPGDFKVIRGESNLVSYATGKEERFSCRMCSATFFCHLHHLKQWGVYLNMFTSPNHGPDGKLDPRFKPTGHIFYTSGLVNVHDGLPKFNDLPAAFGGSDKKVDEQYHK